MYAYCPARRRVYIHLISVKRGYTIGSVYSELALFIFQHTHSMKSYTKSRFGICRLTRKMGMIFHSFRTKMAYYWEANFSEFEEKKLLLCQLWISSVGGVSPLRRCV